MTKWTIKKNPHALPDAKINSIIANPVFGENITDHMSHIHFTAFENVGKNDAITINNGKWTDHEVLPFGVINLTPASLVLHYGQEVFEGLKAYRHEDGSIWLFRPKLNAKRINESAARIGLPGVSESDFIEAIEELVKIDSRWVPSKIGQSLYLRPVIFASENSIGLRSSRTCEFYVIATPVGAYIDSAKPIDIWVQTQYHRAGPGGTGEAKCGGNYAASLLPQTLAYSRGFSQVLYLDSTDKETVEELGGMSIFAVYDNGTVKTPQLNGQILDSITRKSIIELLESKNVNVCESKINIYDLLEDIKSGKVVELFACGTAAIVLPIGSLVSDNFNVKIKNSEMCGEVTKNIRETILGIQMGQIEDKFGWMHRVI